MMEPQLPDEEEGRQNLISQTAPVKNVVNPSTFQIGDDSETAAPSGVCCRFKKRYILAISLLLTLLLLWFASDLKNWFVNRMFWIGDLGSNDSSFNQMHESELQALSLLKQQELELYKIWNYTELMNKSEINLVNNTDEVNLNFGKNDSGNSLSYSLFEDLKSRILNQISLTRRIQGILLSSHGTGSSVDLNETYTDADILSLNSCRKVDQMLSERRTIEWNPRSNKHLFAICVSGQMSNHLICLEKHMFFAALLDRILVIPSPKVDYEFKKILDIEHINKCLGRKVVVTFEEFSESKKNNLHIDRILCYFSLPQPCFLDGDHVSKLKGLGLTLGKVEAVWEEDVKEPKQRTEKDILDKFSLDDDVIAVGDIFFANVERQWVMQPGGPIAHKCKTLIEPSRLILLTAQRFVQTFLGKDFIAVHFRRHGFLMFCNAKKPSCFYSIPQAAECINRVVQMANSPVIYLSTDAAEIETSLLQSFINRNGKIVPLVQRPASNSAEKWDALLYRNGLQGDPQVEAMLDKAICAFSAVFIGSPGSTFTEDILRLRKDWGSASLCDEYVCQGEVPDFIAEDE